jgi:hypothetical protein
MVLGKKLRQHGRQFGQCMMDSSTTHRLAVTSKVALFDNQFIWCSPT